MIDWLTLRTPINHFIGGELEEQFMKHIGMVQHFDALGNKIRTKMVFDIDQLPSDAKGIFWQIQNTGKGLFLTIGASPASLEFNTNVFGSSDVRYCANILVRTAEKHLSMILPPLSAWDCRRIDVTENYLLDDNKQVKQALRELRNGDGTRQKATNNGGDSVYWGAGSDYITGKAYDKGSQQEFLEKAQAKKGLSSPYNEHTLNLVKRLLRLELSLKRLYFEKHKQHFLDITEQQLTDIHTKYFEQFIGKLEVTDMTNLLENLEKVAPSKGYALAAHRTWALIKSIGYDETKHSMPKTTFMKHQQILKLAGLSSADLQSARILEFRKRSIIVAQPIRTWDELLSAA